MKIQIVKKGAPRAGGEAVCPWFIDVPPPNNTKN